MGTLKITGVVVKKRKINGFLDSKILSPESLGHFLPWLVTDTVGLRGASCLLEPLDCGPSPTLHFLLNRALQDGCV